MLENLINNPAEIASLSSTELWAAMVLASDEDADRLLKAVADRDFVPDDKVLPCVLEALTPRHVELDGYRQIKPKLKEGLAHWTQETVDKIVQVVLSSRVLVADYMDGLSRDGASLEDYYRYFELAVEYNAAAAVEGLGRRIVASDIYGSNSAALLALICEKGGEIDWLETVLIEARQAGFSRRQLLKECAMDAIQACSDTPEHWASYCALAQRYNFDLWKYLRDLDEDEFPLFTEPYRYEVFFRGFSSFYSRQLLTLLKWNEGLKKRWNGDIAERDRLVATLQRLSADIPRAPRFYRTKLMRKCATQKEHTDGAAAVMQKPTCYTRA